MSDPDTSPQDANGRAPITTTGRRGARWTTGFLFCCSLVGGCALTPRYADGVYRNGVVAFRLGELGSEWRRARVAGDGIAFHHPLGGSIGAAVTCDLRNDVPLDVLTNHLLFGIEPRKEIARSRMNLDGREALRTRIDGALDGVPVMLDLVVLKKDGCIHDLHLVAGAAAYPDRLPDFDRFVAGFARVKVD